ncbi:MAG: nucleotidyl transferase AbiEii/AbiGii toxin family protein [Candidatus Gracilibacteria bacterium]|nr:nucleotidyl transferase AbiEii/AbiGii toxin family protein [Candidatus Gracilibacteria bacterium]
MFISQIFNFLERYQNIEKEKFLEILSISNTQAFQPFKFEKDFLLTLILIKFGEKYPDLVFKGGTCLNKIYFPYFRLSEDLDFVLDVDLGRSARKTLLKEYENNFIDDLAILGMTLRDERTKFDEYKLAMFTFEYNSIIDDSIQTIKIDIALKQRLLLSPVPGRIQSIFIEPVYEESLFGDHTISCINLSESIAEKMRAALTRGTPAIRDFFDIWYVKQYSAFDFDDIVFRELVYVKLQEVEYLYTLDEYYELLKKQVTTDLMPVLSDTYDFDFQEIYDFILSFKKPR